MITLDDDPIMMENSMTESSNLLEKNTNALHKYHVYIASVEFRWLEHHLDHGNLFQTLVVRATEG